MNATQASAAATTSPRTWIALCFLIAMIEGFDIQAAGVAAPRLAPALHLGPREMGLFFGAATLGLIVGALVGGRLADRIGRKQALLLAMLIFGICSIMTAFAFDFNSLLAARLLTGLGIGGAMPSLVAIVAEASKPGRTTATVALLYAGLPAGGAVASLVAAMTIGGGWQQIFLIGGLAPLAVAPFLMRAVPLPLTARAGGRGEPVSKLFAGTLLASTALLWVSFFCALLVHGLLLNWLPSLLVSRGLGPAQAGQMQIFFNIAGALGSTVAGRAMDRFQPRIVIVAAFAWLMAALTIIAEVPAQLVLVLAAAGLVGLGSMGVQGIIYGLAPRFYPPALRGTGVGAAMAVGRFGSFAGPLLAGWLVVVGGASSGVLLGLLPFALVSALASLLLAGRLAAGAIEDKLTG